VLALLNNRFQREGRSSSAALEYQFDAEAVSPDQRVGFFSRKRSARLGKESRKNPSQPVHSAFSVTVDIHREAQIDPIPMDSFVSTTSFVHYYVIYFFFKGKGRQLSVGEDDVNEFSEPRSKKADVV
jgi:hypothetical protein